MKLRDICLDVVAYFGIAAILLLGAPTEWKNNQKALSVISVIVALFMIWEGIENYLNHTCSLNPTINNNSGNAITGTTTTTNPTSTGSTTTGTGIITH